jgi:hypothetical protein
VVSIGPAPATAARYTASKIFYSPIDRAVRTVENQKERIFISLMDVGQRCVETKSADFIIEDTTLKSPGGLLPRFTEV